jgi:hypothetical protein
VRVLRRAIARADRHRQRTGQHESADGACRASCHTWGVLPPQGASGIRTRGAHFVVCPSRRVHSERVSCHAAPAGIGARHARAQHSPRFRLAERTRGNAANTRYEHPASSPDLAWFAYPPVVVGSARSETEVWRATSSLERASPAVHAATPWGWRDMPLPKASSP